MSAPVLAIPTPAKVIRAESCASCKYAERAGQMFECHFNPPFGGWLPTPRGPQPVSAFLPVHGEHWCGQYKVKLSS